MSETPARPIRAVYGMEPHREGEYPTAHIVGSESSLFGGWFRVTRIERREENLGTYGLVWFDIYAEHPEGERVRCSMQGMAVAEVHYDREDG